MQPRPIILIDTAIIGGPGRGIFQLINALKHKSIHYLLCNFQYTQPKSKEFIDETCRQHFNLSLLKQRFFLDPLPFFQFFKLICKGRYNLVQSHGYKSHLVAAIVSKITNKPWVAFAHGWTSEDSKVKIYHKLDTLLLRFATVVIAVSPELKNLFSDLRGESKRTELILNAVDQSSLSSQKGGEEIKKENKIEDGDLVIGCFGRFSFEKGQDVLLKAFAQLEKQNYKIHLLLLGDGKDRSKLEQMCIELGITDKVHFLKHSSHMRDYYEAIDLLVLPSRSEGLPNVILEAMSFAVPVIASEVGAVKEVINNGINGWTVKSDDSDALAESISRALDSPARLQQIGIAGRNSLFPKFSPNLGLIKLSKFTSSSALNNSLPSASVASSVLYIGSEVPLKLEIKINAEDATDTEGLRDFFLLYSVCIKNSQP